METNKEAWFIAAEKAVAEYLAKGYKLSDSNTFMYCSFYTGSYWEDKAKAESLKKAA
jgi:hypothetical protein